MASAAFLQTVVLTFFVSTTAFVFHAESRRAASRRDIEGALAVTVTPICSWDPPPASPLCSFDGSDLCREIANYRLRNPTALQLAERLIGEAINISKRADATAKFLHKIGEDFVFAGKPSFYSELIGYWEKGMEALRRKDFTTAKESFMKTPETIAECVDQYAVNCVESAMHVFDKKLYDYAHNSVGILLNNY